MKTYKITVKLTTYSIYKVEAENEDHARLRYEAGNYLQTYGPAGLDHDLKIEEVFDDE